MRTFTCTVCSQTRTEAIPATGAHAYPFTQTVAPTCKHAGEDHYTCPRCGGETSKEWQGMVAIADYTKSEIAKKMGITANGQYALKVR